MQVNHHKQWAQSSQGRPISMTEFCSQSSADPAKRPTLLIGGVHGDEPEGVILGQECERWLTHTQQAGLIPSDRPWIIIPCLNPDGVAINQRVNGRGVDLNRNYPASNWSPEFSKDRYYPGPYPASEPEIQALVRLIEERKPQLIIHFHAWKPSIVLTGPSGADQAHSLSESSGYPVLDTIGYPTPGSLSHYGWQDLGVPIICIEEEEWMERDRCLHEIDPKKIGNTYAPALWQRWQKGFEALFCPSLKEERS